MTNPARSLAAMTTLALLFVLAYPSTAQPVPQDPPGTPKDGEAKKEQAPPPRDAQLVELLDRMNAAITRLINIEDKLTRFEDRIKGVERANDRKTVLDQLATMQQDILSIKTQIQQIQIDMSSSTSGTPPSTSRRLPAGPGAPAAPGVPGVPPQGSGRGTINVVNRCPYAITVFINDLAFTVNAQETRYFPVNAGQFTYRVPSANQVEPIARRVEANKSYELTVNPVNPVPSE